ncbi:cell wall-binding repeat-containing protein [uncultured Serinicoccus sp.]|uniref:cell wall-binding repeat-containing protein n=1 Tax=uncultured Serinicoccus sp. TaxID=735514 RepID=UPI0026335C4B|nr:cell wall-binding repeat-containing protein [uncultured Serinicoccus sp.]
MHQPSARRRTRLLALAGAGAVVAPLALVAPAAWANPEITVNEDGTYIVMLADSSLAAYEGGVSGIPATKPAEGEKLSTTSAAAEEYTAYLDRQQNAVLDSVGLDRADAVYTYSTSFNGFTAELTGSQVSALRKDPAVAAVWEDEIRTTDTVTTPDYLGLTGEDGVWNTQFGGDADAGAGMVVGIIDTGFWPENPSFAALPGDPAAPDGWQGECVEGDAADDADNVTCNSKVIGARYYPEGNTTDFDFLSPRDTDGHGSHVGGTSAGNVGVPMDFMGDDLGVGSGMAPAAHLAFYKALWATEDGGGSGTTGGLVAAIDDAVADGVDVINYSVSGSSQFVVTPDELAFLDAANAGVFVSTSAGNSGDDLGPSSVAHNSPWTMTVAASTHDRTNSAEVELGDGPPVTRVSGTDRYDTAAQIAAAYPEGVDTVYIATGNQFADALSGAAAASQGLVPATGLDQPAVAPDGSPAPVLLTKVDEIPGATMDALESIDPDNIVVLGGEVAVSDSVAEELEDYGTVTRVAGADRYETAALVAQQYGEVDHVYVATGQDEAFPDALSGSALAGSEGVPVLLTKTDMVPSAVTETLAAMGDPEVHVIGGEVAVSEDVYEDLGASARLSGTNRYGTSVAVAEEFGFGEDNPAPVVHTATGRDYPDALAGSALAGYQGVPVMLSRPDMVPSVVLDGMVALAPESAFILGGEGALSNDVQMQIEALFGEDETFAGISSGEGVGPAPLVNSVDIPAAGATADDAELCLPGSLDAAEAADHIVICTRGANARVEKSETVEAAGGVGMILANNTDDESLNGDFHSVPTIHVNGTAGDAIKEYEASDPDPMATISASGEGPEITVPEMAGFSSYGPATAGGGDLLKPDITAPGVDVIAAVSPAGSATGSNFDSLSGTSMSAPHIAGLAALMMQDNPDWGPMGVKSAMMTTADPTNSEGELITYAGEPASPLHYGSGEVEPGAAYDTPLVYDSGLVDWYAYACAIGQLQLVGGASVCDQIGTTDPSDLNYPSIAIGDLGGAQTVTRTVTDATGNGGTFTAEVEAPPGVDVVVEPSTVTVAPDASATFTVSFTTAGAPLDEWTFGSLTWTGPGADVTSPLAIRPVAMGAPEEIRGETTEGAAAFEVTPGFSGELTSVPHGLVASDVTDVEVTSDGPSGGADIVDEVVPVTVPEGTTAIRVEVVASEWAPDGLDLDLYLATADGTVVGQSAAGGSDESVTVVAPAPGDYLVAIDYWDGAAGDTANGPLHVFMPSADEGNMSVTPSPVAVTAGTPLELTAAWTGLEAATRYMGAIGYSDGTEEVAYTLVSVNTP